MIELVRESERTWLFRSDDPAEAARFVVSDAVAAIWAAYRDRYGVDEMLKVAVDHMLRWESTGGWTRFGGDWVAEQETTLTSILVRYLTIPDLWVAAAQYYLEALDEVGRPPHLHRGFVDLGTNERTSDLRVWHGRLIHQLAGQADEELLDRLVAHPALGA